MPINNHEFYWFWFIGSIIPDTDHLFVLYGNKIFSLNKIINSMRFEDKYNLHYKTKYLHSVFGAIIMTIPIAFIDMTGALYFFVAYIGHLLLDWSDQDEKQYLFPFCVKFRGFLPIFSKPEIIFSVFLIGFYFIFL